MYVYVHIRMHDVYIYIYACIYPCEKFKCMHTFCMSPKVTGLLCTCICARLCVQFGA